MAFPISRAGERILAREWRTDELEGMHRWLSDPNVNRFLSWGTRTRAESAQHFRETLQAQRAKPRTKYYLALELKAAPGLTIGDAGFTWMDPQVAEIGYFLEPAYWGRGYATEAAQIVIALALELGAKRILASCDARNTASEAVMQRCGMQAVRSQDHRRRAYALVP